MKTKLLSLLLAAAMLILAFPLAIPAGAEEESPSLYVQDGLVMLLDAFDPQNGTLDLTAGTWKSSKGNATATLEGAWKAEKQGISYALSAISGGTGLNLGYANLPKGSFTVEAVAAAHGLTNPDGSKVPFDSTYGPSYAYSFAFGPFKGYGFPGKRGEGVANPNADPRYCSHEVMWYYAAQGSNVVWLADDYVWNDHLDTPTDVAITATFNAAGVTYALYDGANKAHTIAVKQPATECDEMFRLFTSFPATVYAVRVYDRVLSAAERAQNHFADLCAYAGVDAGTRIGRFSAAKQQALFLEFANVSFTEEGLAGRLEAALSVLMPEDLLIPSPATPEERAQDHFARLAVKAALDLSDFAPLSAEKRQEVYALFASLTEEDDVTDIRITYALALGDLTAAVRAAVKVKDISVRRDGTPNGITGARYVFEVNRRAMQLLEQNYAVTVGAVAGLASAFQQDGTGLVISGKDGTITAPAHARAVTVYSSTNYPITGHFLPDSPDCFAVTVSMGTEDYATGVLVQAFLLLQGSDGKQTVYRIFTELPDTSLNGIAQMQYNNKGDNQTMQVYTDLLQDQLRLRYDALADSPVRVCGEDKADGEKAIWIQYLPHLDPWAGDTDAEKAGIKAFYLYYPMEQDPSTLSESALLEMGCVRVFGYAGAPADMDNPTGLVCVHGGLGHAYANYVLEGIRNGFASIALDTEGYRNTTAGAGYSEAEAAYERDPLGHKPKDEFVNAEKDFSTQWLYYAVGDTIMARTVMDSGMLSFPVYPGSTGLTGISWGGLIVSTTICYDYNFAFCVPVYISFHMNESYGVSVGGLPNKPFAAALWQDTGLLAASPVPTMILSSERDRFASINTIVSSYQDLQNGTLTVKPGLSHSQQSGASPAEIYRFGRTVLQERDGFITCRQPKAEDGRSFTLTLTVPEDFTDVKATLYYRTEPLIRYSQDAQMVFQKKDLTVENGQVKVEVPAEAVMYYISFSGMCEEVARIKQTTPYGDAYPKGTLYSSTTLVVLEKQALPPEWTAPVK